MVTKKNQKKFGLVTYSLQDIADISFKVEHICLSFFTQSDFPGYRNTESLLLTDENN